MSMVIDELITILGVELDPKAQASIAAFSKSIDSISTSVKIVVGAITAAATSIGYFTKRSADAVFELDKMSRISGLSSRTIQEMGFASQMLGGSFEGLAGDLMNLNKSMSSPIPGEFNQTLFMLGINTKKANGELKTADQVLLDVADKFQNMNKVQQMQWASRLGLSDDTLLMLQKGRSEIERLQKQARDFPLILSNKQLEQTRDFTIQWRMMQKVLTFMGQLFAVTIVPYIGKIVSAVTEWVGKNKEFIGQGIQKVIQGISEGFHRFWDILMKVKDLIKGLIPDMGGFLDKFDLIKLTAAMVSSFLSALAIILVIFAAKWMLVVAAITAAGLVFEDIMTYFQGGESVLGSLIDKVKELGGAFEEKFPAIADLVKSLWEVLKGLALVVKDRVVGSFQLLWDVLKPIGELLAKISGTGMELLEKALGYMGYGKDSGMSESAAEMMEGVRGAQSRGIGAMRRSVQALTSPEAPGFGGSISGGKNAGTNKSVQNNNQITNTFNIGGDNAPGIASEVSRKLNTSLAMTYPGDMVPVTN